MMYLVIRACNDGVHRSADYAFASAFTQIFVDSEDLSTINKAAIFLNNASSQATSRILSLKHKRLVDSDRMDLAYIKWARSAINLHNNHVGRQVSCAS